MSRTFESTVVGHRVEDTRAEWRKRLRKERGRSHGAVQICVSMFVGFSDPQLAWGWGVCVGKFIWGAKIARPKLQKLRTSVQLCGFLLLRGHEAIVSWYKPTGTFLLL
ncbi:hypothetical protein C8R44DRAFT_860550 [Mycena epipterygia]|nr:hypothetical protein C8R44DRAFT_860550 [Mycena epipterygia]